MRFRSSGLALLAEPAVSAAFDASSRSSSCCSDPVSFRETCARTHPY